MSGTHAKLRGKPAAERYAAAMRALCENAIAEHAAGIDEETPEYLRLNHEVIEAERGVSWWRREMTGQRILRELDYWHRMGGQ